MVLMTLACDGCRTGFMDPNNSRYPLRIEASKYGWTYNYKQIERGRLRIFALDAVQDLSHPGIEARLTSRLDDIGRCLY